MHTAALLVGPEQGQGQLRIILLHAAEVVGIHYAHITLPGDDGFHQGSVVGEYVGGQIRHPATHDFLGFFFAQTLDHGRHQGLVVDLLGGAQAQAPFPLGLGQGFVAGQRRRVHPVRGIDQGAGPHGQAEPAVLRVGQFRRHIGGQHRRLQRLQQILVRCIPQVAGVHGDQHIRRRALTFRLQTGGQSGGVVGDIADFHAGGFGIGIEYRLDQMVIPRGIDHQFFFGGGFGAGPQPGKHDNGGGQKRNGSHSRGLHQMHKETRMILN